MRPGRSLAQQQDGAQRGQGHQRCHRYAVAQCVGGRLLHVGANVVKRTAQNGEEVAMLVVGLRQPGTALLDAPDVAGTQHTKAGGGGDGDGADARLVGSGIIEWRERQWKGR